MFVFRRRMRPVSDINFVAECFSTSTSWFAMCHESTNMSLLGFFKKLLGITRLQRKTSL